MGAVPYEALPLLQFFLRIIVFIQAKFKGREKESLGMRLIMYVGATYVRIEGCT